MRQEMATTSCLYFCFLISFPVDMSASKITTGTSITLYRRCAPGMQKL